MFLRVTNLIPPDGKASAQLNRQLLDSFKHYLARHAVSKLTAKYQDKQLRICQKIPTKRVAYKVSDLTLRYTLSEVFAHA